MRNVPNALINAGKFALLLFLVRSSFASVAITTFTVAHADGSGNDFTSAGVPTTGANALFVYVATINGRAFTLSDSKANTWTGLTITTSNGNQVGQMFYAKNASVGTNHTFSIAQGGGGAVFGCISMLAVSGANSNPFDVQNTNQSASATTLTTGSVTPSVDNEIAVAGIAYHGTASPVTINGGFTTAGLQEFAGGNYGCGIAYLIQTTAAAANPTWTRTGSADDTSAGIAAFKSSIAGPAAGFLRWAP